MVVQHSPLTAGQSMTVSRSACCASTASFIRLLRCHLERMNRRQGFTSDDVNKHVRCTHLCGILVERVRKEKSGQGGDMDEAIELS